MRTLITFCLLFFISVTQAQNFEGYVTYKIEMKNPYPDKITDEQFKEMLKGQFGEQGYGTQTTYYKGNQYATAMTMGSESGFQTYNPEDGLLYAWQEGTKDAVTVNSKKYMDQVQSVTETNETATIMGIACKQIVIKSAFGETKVWYNSDYFKMDAALYKGHVYGHWEAILTKTGCLPVKIEMGGMAPAILTLMDHKEETVPDSKFTLPEFDTVTANPMN